MAKKIQLTQEGLEALQAELKELKSVARVEIAAKLKEAISYGDLSENSEYQDARDQQAAIELRISELEDIMSNYEIIEADHSKTKKGLAINIGNRVEICKLDEKGKEGEKMTFDLVGSTEVDVFSEPPKISNESPIGRSLIGKTVGEIAKDDPNNPDESKRVPSADAGSFSYKVLKVV